VRSMPVRVTGQGSARGDIGKRREDCARFAFCLFPVGEVRINRISGAFGPII
jgi:hypothetical protein